MREELKTQLCGAGGALTTAVIAGALQTDKLGSSPFNYQIFAAVAVACWIPFLVRIQFFAKVPKIILVPVFLVWFSLAGGPVSYAFLKNVFTGHRRPDATWFDAAWRVYAIMGLWIGFALINEHYIRPWWRQFSEHYLSSYRKDTVASKAHEIASKKRVAALEALKSRVRVVLRKKKLAEQNGELKKQQIEKAEENIKKAEVMLQKAKDKLGDCEESDRQDAKDNYDTMKSMLESAKTHKQSLLSDVEKLAIDVDEFQIQLDGLQTEWTEALHISNYTTFYR